MLPAPDTRETILDAAEHLFAARGFTATTIKDIGRQAGVNSALLYYYFANKDALYDAVLEQVFGRLAQQLRRGLQSGTTPTDAIAAFVRAQVVLMSARPAVPHLLVREMIDNQGAHARIHITRLAAGSFQLLCEAIREGQRRGDVRRDIVPEFAAISTIAQVAYFFIARPAMGLLLGHGTEGPPPSTVEAFGTHAAAFALGALGASEASARLAAEVRT